MERQKWFHIAASAVALFSLLLASCAPAASPAPTPASKATAAPAKAETAAAKPAAAPTAPAATPKPAAGQPRYGGVLTSYITANPPSLDAHQETTANTTLLVSPVYTNLVQADPLKADKLAPGLAEKWEMSRDGLAWTFDMHQGVKFHDGTAFTPDDAVFSLKRITDPPRGVVSNMTFVLRPAVKSIARDGNKVVVNLNYPLAVMLETLGHNFSPMYSQKTVEKLGDMKTTAMGTGPFKLKSYSPGIGLEAVKNPDFWVKGRPYLDGYRFLIIRDMATRLSAFRTGKVNLTGKAVGTLTPAEMETVKKENPELQFFPAATPLGPWFFMNVRKPPFKDQKVRKAIGLALDRQAALKVVAQEKGVIGKPFPVEPWGIPMNDLLKAPGFRQPKNADIAEAKKLMEAAAYAAGFEMTILTRYMWQAKDAAIFMTSQLAQIGVKAKVDILEDAIFFDMGRKATFDAMVYTPVSSFSDPQWMGRYFEPGSPTHYTGNDDDKELASMWREQVRIVDVEKRKALIRKIEEHLLEVYPSVPIVWPFTFTGVRPEVKNFFPGMGDYYGNTLEEIWLAK
ncbi:MAG: hypothetical protein HYX92_15470 [Chloroflexi bacterium]|nr:hypothetical protein [Chloroflexota bacterium]